MHELIETVFRDDIEHSIKSGKKGHGYGQFSA